MRAFDAGMTFEQHLKNARTVGRFQPQRNPETDFGARCAWVIRRAQGDIMIVRLLAMSFAVTLAGCSVSWNTGTPQSSNPRFTDNTVFVRCRQGTGGPYTLIDLIGKNTPDKGDANEFGTSVDGIAPNICVVNWKFIRTTELGDIYDFTYGLRGADGTCSQVQEKQATYNGKEIIVFQTGFHQVGMTPAPTPATMPSEVLSTRSSGGRE
jgi:hypothetical protein